MHKPSSRFASILAGGLLLVAGVTCTDNPTGPRSGRGGTALVGFAPAFSQVAADIYRSLVNFQLEVDNIHVHLDHANGTTAMDTTVVFSAGADSVVIELSVTLNSSTELLDAEIELRDGNTVLFSGTQEINARAGGLPSTSPPVELDYTGPGFLATTFDVGPPDTTVFTNDSVTFQASAKDANGQNVSDIVVAWSLKDPARGTVDNAGKFKPNAGRGATYVLANLPSGLKDSGRVNVVPPPTKVVVISGGGQTGTVGKPLPAPIVIEAQANDNLPVPTAKLTFASSGGGSLSTAAATTDANGRASVTLTLGSVAGANTIEVAGVGIQPITISATGAADAATLLAITQQPSTSASSGSPFATQPKAQLKDAHGNAAAVANIPVTAALTQADGRTLQGTLTVNTNASGVVEFTDLKISGPPGTATLTFAAASVTSAVSIGIAVAIGPPATLMIVSGDGQGALPNEALPNALVIKAVDAGGNPVPSTNVTFSVTSGGGSLAGGTSVVTTNASGLASVNWSVGSGAQILTATVGSVTTQLRAFIAEQVIITNALPLTPQSGVPMNPQPVVRLADSEGNFVKRAGIVITANAAATPPIGDYSLFMSDGISTTDANGVATFASLAIQGDIEQHGVVKFYRLIGESIDANVAPGISPEIAMQPGFPSELVAQDVQYHRLDAPGTKSLGFRTTDFYNNVPNVPVVFTVKSGACTLSATSATTDVSGLASVNATLTASLSSCVVQSSVNLAPPAGATPAHVEHRIYVAPPGTFVWTGRISADWSTGSSYNWLDGVSPSSAPVFIPAASEWDFRAKVAASTTVQSLVVESGAHLDLNAQTIAVGGGLAVDGAIDGTGTVAIDGRDDVRAPGEIHALLKVGSAADYTVTGNVKVDALELNNALRLTEAFTVHVVGALRALGVGRLYQDKGDVVVEGDASFTAATSIFTGGTMRVTGELATSGAGALNQSGGLITVFGDARFEGGISNLTNGVLELKRNFYHTGNGDNQRFLASNPHVTLFNGVADGSELKISVNAFSGIQFAQLHIQTSGAAGAAFFTVDTATVPIIDLNVLSGGRLRVPLRIFVDAGHVSGFGVRVATDGVLVNEGAVIVYAASCTIPQGSNSNKICLTP